MRLLGSAIAFLAIVAFYFQYIVTDRTTAVFQAGLVASVATVIMFGSPLASLVCCENQKRKVTIDLFSFFQRDVVQKQSTESLSLPLCFANFIVPIEWVLYGILINDKFVQVKTKKNLLIGFIFL